MNRKLILYMILFYLPIVTIAQIGVNTNNPSRLLHIDGAGDNSTTSLAKDSNDVVFTTDGDIGIGTLSPQAKVHIVTDGQTIPSVRLADGSQAAKKILISDDNGVGKWGEAVFNSFGVIPYAYTTYTGPATTLYDTGLSFTFPSAGVYSVSLGVKVKVDIPNFPDIKWAQLLPTVTGDLITIWRAQNPRFQGGYEVFQNGSFIDLNSESISSFVFNQTLTVTEDMKTMHLVIQVGGWTANRTIFVSWGNYNNSITPSGDPSIQVGGSYIKIN